MTEEIFQKIIANYPMLHKARIVNELKNGLSNNYAFEAERVRYFLKQYRHSNFEKVREIHNVKKYLHDGGIPVIQPMYTAGNDTLVEIEDSMYAVFPFVVGLHQKESAVGDAALDELAHTLADIHKLSVSNPFVINDTFHDWNPDKFMNKAEAILAALDCKPNLTELDEQMKQGVILKRELVSANKKKLADFDLPNDTLCHGDYHVYNVFFDQKGKVEWVFDLEKAEMAPRVFELVRSMNYMNLGGNFDDAHMAKANTYVNAYHGYYPLIEGEFARGVEMRFVKDFHSLWIEGEVFLKNNDRFNRFYEAEFRSLVYLKDHLADFIKKLKP
jgi:homoserine kinase type II